MPDRRDIQIRDARKDDAADLGRILVGATNETFRGLVPGQCLEWTAEQSAANWARNFNEDGLVEDGEWIFVAEAGPDGVVGFAMLGAARPNENADRPVDRSYTHELLSLHVAPEWQRRGIGRLLLARVAQELSDQGISHLLVGVVQENPNRVFYERLGAAQLAARPYNWSGYKTNVVLYGWDKLDAVKDKDGMNGQIYS